MEKRDLEGVGVESLRSAAEIERPEEAGDLPELPVGRNAPDLEEYVELQLAISRAEIERGSRGSKNVFDPEARLAKAEEYARWRHAGFVAGEIVSL